MENAQTQKQSRNGKRPVEVLAGVNVEISGQDVTVKGPKGEIKRTFRSEVVIEKGDGGLTVSPAPNSGKAGTQFQGLSRALLNNMMVGAAKGFVRSLDFRGVGYRAEFKDGHLKMSVGMSHQPVLAIPSEVKVKIEQVDEAGLKFPRVVLESVDKEVVGRVAARIRSIRPPEPYKGKGVRYTGETIVLKAGKTGK